MSSVTIEEDPMPEIPRGDTRRFQITIRDGNGNLADPDWVKLRFMKASGVRPRKSYGLYSCINSSIGIWYLDFYFPRDAYLGEWVREWTWNFDIAGTDYPGDYQSSIDVVDKLKKLDTFE